ncbi:dehydrin DHN1-like [Olea europaea subsp. europaea]|uniref:Dehydrin DHN1-like n=1 Tax=Olea europaea subsp. europaea TaxID=158383 RepID=A0A8S0SGM3_OLEEU|nr:dehydrin DHN1-like [Olea europaea subsp. europaea]
MAEYGEQCVDQTRRTDEYGNPVRQAAGGITGEYGATGGNVGEFGTTGEYGNKGGGIGAGTTDGASLTGEYQGQLRRSGSGSSSSEDDGQGGRRKKGLKDKIEDKLTGSNKEDQTYNLASKNTTPAGYEATGERGEEKKGMMDKMMDKLPGRNN